jgi:hypothetical protein
MASPSLDGFKTVNVLLCHRYKWSSLYVVGKCLANLEEISWQWRSNQHRADLPQGDVGLSLSPDRKWIVFTANKAATSELIMIEDFH